MASSEHEGGIGGKFRKRPFRRAPATPYDRPQAAITRTNPNPNPNIDGNNGWISKIVDPASRIIAQGASKFFSSVFQKRLTAPPAQPPPEENLLSRHKAPVAVCNNLQMHKPSDKSLERIVNAAENTTNDYETDGTQRETLSGTTGFFELEQLLKQKTFTRAEFERLTDLLRSRTVEPSTSKLAVDYENREEAVVTEEAKHNELSIIEPSASHPAVTYERKEKAIASEQRVKSSNLHGDISNPAVNFPIPEEEAVSPAEIAKAYMGSRPSKVSPSTLSVRSQIEDAALPTASYAKKSSMVLLASRPSVHFSGIQEHSENGYMTPRPRGRSALYKMSRSPYFKVNPTTNIRVGRPVRVGLASSSTSFPLVPPKSMLSSGKQVLKRRSSELESDFGSFGPIRRIRQKYNLMSPSSERHSSPPGNLLTPPTTSLAQDVNQRSAPSTQKPVAGVHPIPPQSTEMARKIFQELGKLVPSPKEKSSENKGSGNLNAASDSPLPSLRYSVSPEHDRIKENNPSENAISAVKASHEVGMKNSIKSTTDVKSNRKTADISISGSSAIPSQKEPASQMIAAKESLELEANKHSMDNAFGLSSTGNEKLLERSDVKASDWPASEKGGDFMFSARAASVFQLSPTSTILSPLADMSVPKKYISVTASKSASNVSLTTTVVCDPASMKCSASAIPTAGILESSDSDKRGKTRKDADLYISFGNASRSGLSTSNSHALFTFGATPGPNQSNGSLTSPSSSYPVSSDSAAACSRKNSITANSSSSSIAAVEPIFASPPSFQFGSGASTGSSISISRSKDKFDAGDSDRTSIKASPPSSIPGTSSAFLNTNVIDSTPATSSVFSSIGGNSSVPATPALLLNTTSGSSPMSTSSAFPSPMNDGSTFGAQLTQPGSGTSSFPHSSAVTSGFFSSEPAFGLNASSSLSSGISPFGSADSVGTASGSHTGFSSAVVGSSRSAGVPFFPPTAASGLSSSNSQPSSSSMLASTLGSNLSSPSTGFTFGSSASTSANLTTPFGASSRPVFSFSSVSTTTSSASPSSSLPVFAMPMQGTGFSSGSPGSDQMNIEDGMADDNIQAAAPSVPTFGQPATSLSTPNLQLGNPAAASGGSSVFQFGRQHNSTVPPQNPSPFHTAGSFEFSTGGSFSLGRGGDQSGRRFIRVKRDKHRKK